MVDIDVRPPGAEQAATPLVEALGVRKTYGPVVALAGVNLVVRPGEVVALAGENGSGKSTLAKILAGVVRADGGEIRIDGRPHTGARPRDALDAGVAMVAQEPTAVPALSVAENVLLGSLRRPADRFRRGRQIAAARPLLADVGLEHVDPARPFASLASGEREMAEVAKALASRPRLLVLDEATSRLPDPERLFDVVEGLRRQGVATILITHRLSEIRRLADRAVVLRDGRLVGELPRAEIDDERLSMMMVGRDLQGFFHRTRRDPGTGGLHVDELVVAGCERPVSLHVRPGEIVGLAGLEGAGRTELLETIAGVRATQRGRVLVDGRTVPASSVRGALAAGLALVPEDRMTQGVVLGASVADNIALGPVPPLALAPRQRERAAAHAAVQQLRIRTADVDASVRTLSGGNQQKVVLARCLARSPRVLLLDEPTRGIDIGAKTEIYTVLDGLLDRGLAVLIASSEMLELLGLCDRILVLHEQAIAGEMTHEDASEERIALLSAGGGVGHGD